MFRDLVKNKEMYIGIDKENGRNKCKKQTKITKVFTIALAFILIFSLVFTFTACTPDMSPVDSQDGDGQTGTLSGNDKVVYAGNEVKYPSGVKYFVQNKLTVEEVKIELTDEEKIDLFGEVIEDENQGQYNVSYIKIYGLKDIEVQNKINADLERICREHIGYIPPYRGVKAKFGEDPKLAPGDYYSVREDVFFNNNNILSVNIAVSAAYMTDLSQWSNREYIYFQDTYNVDLNTGEEIAINDIFCNDVDGLAYVNNKVSEFIADSTGDEEGWFYGGDLKINQPFKGIKPEQKYHLSMNGMQVIFDYATPEFDVGYSSYSITIPYCDEMAVTERFFSEDENIYASNAPLVKSFAADSTQYEYIVDEYDTLNGYINVSRRATCPEDTPQSIKDALKEYAQLSDEEIIAEFQPYYDEATQHGDAEVSWADANQTSYVRRIGNYLNVQYNAYRYMSYQPASGGNMETAFYRDDAVYQIYYIGDGNGEPTEIELKDIFKPEVDMKAIIKQAMIDSINRGVDYRNEDENYEGEYERFIVDGSSGDGEKEALNREYIDRVYDSINGFSLSTDSVYVYIEAHNGKDLNGAAAIYEEVFGVNPYNSDGGYLYIHALQNLAYGDLGCENLVIFE